MNKIYCSNCGRMIPKSSNFCRHCGAPQHGPEAAAYQAELPTVNNAPAAFVLAQANKPKKSKKRKDSGDIKNGKLAKIASLAFFVNYIGKTAIIILLLAFGAFFDPIIFGIILISYLVLLYIVAIAVHDSFRFSIDHHGFQKEYGILHKQEVTIPYSQIENVNITRSFIDMIFGLARVNIETAGSSITTPRNIIGGRTATAEGHLPGVSLSDARKIHDLLLDRCAAAKE